MAQIDTHNAARRLTTETKSAFKTTEFVIYIAVVIIIAITANQIDATAGHPDGVSAHDALRLITWATVGYLVSRGLAKSGSRDAYWDDQSTRGPGDSANVR